MKWLKELVGWKDKPKPDYRELMNTIWTKAMLMNGSYPDVMEQIGYKPPAGFNVESLWFTRKVSEACFAYKEFMCK